MIAETSKSLSQKRPEQLRPFFENPHLYSEVLYPCENVEFCTVSKNENSRNVEFCTVSRNEKCENTELCTAK